MGPAPGLLSGDHRRAGPGKGVEDNLIAPRTIPKGIGHKIDRLHRRMHGKGIIARPAKAVDAGIFPDICPVPPVLAELEVIDMLGRALLESEDQLVARAIEGAHAAVGLHPNAKILQFLIDAFAGSQDFGHMPPIHTDEVNRAVGGSGCQVTKNGLQKPSKLVRGHFAGRHGEFAVLLLAKAGDVTRDRHVVRRIGKDDRGLGLAQQCRIGGRVRGIATEQSMPAKPPEVARAGDGRFRRGYGRHFIVEVLIRRLSRRGLIQNEYERYPARRRRRPPGDARSRPRRGHSLRSRRRRSRRRTPRSPGRRRRRREWSSPLP